MMMIAFVVALGEMRKKWIWGNIDTSVALAWQILDRLRLVLLEKQPGDCMFEKQSMGD